MPFSLTLRTPAGFCRREFSFLPSVLIPAGPRAGRGSDEQVHSARIGAFQIACHTAELEALHKVLRLLGGEVADTSTTPPADTGTTAGGETATGPADPASAGASTATPATTAAASEGETGASSE
jgi:hypothetical protein